MRWRPLSVRIRLTLWYTGVLCAILLVISGLSYSLLRLALRKDLDTSLLTVAEVIRDTGYSAVGAVPGADPEATIREILGPEFYDKFFQLVDLQGKPGARSPHLPAAALPLSDRARANAARGARTFETVRLGSGEPVRLVTLPIIRDGQLVQLVQVGISTQRAERSLGRYLETLLVLIPLGIGLAAAGGLAIARTALRPVDAMSQTARRITGEDLVERVTLRGTGDELDRLADTFNAMLARLQSAFVQMRRFTADAAHELRTPLTALRGGIEVALRSPRSEDEYRRVLRSSLEEVERLVRLAEDLLLLSRFSAGAGAARARVDLEPLLLDALDVATRLAHDRELALKLGAVTPAVVLGDAGALRRAVLNLVENAVKYTPDGGTIELALTHDGGHASIVVRDTGVGIDPAEAEQIFQPFVRLDAARARETGGTGLGLSIARSIATAHGGALTVESTPGAGSAFTLRLPLA